MGEFKISGVSVFADTTIDKAGSVLSNAINMSLLKADGFNGLQLTSLSAGTGATILGQVVVCATEDGTYTIPKTDATAIDDIVTAHADGQQYYSFPAFPIAPFMKIKLTENNVEAVTAFEGRLTTD